MLVRSRKHRRPRSRLDVSNTPSGNDTAAALSLDGGVVVMTVTLPVTVNGIPQVLVNGIAPTGASQANPVTVRLSYATPAASGDGWVVPIKDGAIRTSNGGYVASATGTF